ncbi:LamG-like jellyroll fold domain-containing protein [Labedella phragmitis]|nr:LamG-like jellyroll fold domain-containing protein [Labedella phragmitis]
MATSRTRTLLADESATDGEVGGRARRYRSRARAALALLGPTIAATALVAATLAPAGAANAEARPVDPTDPTTPATVTADVLPTPQIGDGTTAAKGDVTNGGVVWDQLVVGNTVYVAGAFSKARPAGSGVGQNIVTRNHMLAYDVTTGKLLPFAPVFNAPVRSLAISPDGKTLYAGGDFTRVNGAARTYAAAFEVASSSLVPSFAPVLNRGVNAVAASASAVYLGGTFTAAQKTVRYKAAAVAPGTGALLPWDPKLTGGEVKAIVIAGGGTRVVLGGRFLTSAGKDALGLASVAPDTAALQPWAVGGVIRNGEDITDPATGKTGSSGIYSLATAGDSVYGTGWAYGTGNFEGTFKARAADGAIQWLEDCRGDNYSVQPLGDVVYTASHHHDCSNVSGFGDYVEPEGQYRGLAFSNAATGKVLAKNTTFWSHAGQPAPSLLHWFPAFDTGLFTGSNQGPWDVTTGGGYVLYGGEFRSVNGVKQTGLARFAAPPAAPQKNPPRLSGTKFTPTLEGFQGTGVKLSWPANDDRDSSRLRYEIIRDGNTAKPVFSTSWIGSTFWQKPTVRGADAGLVPGTTYTYQVRSIDPDGNATMSAPVTYTATTGVAGPLTDYDRAVLGDQPASYYPFNESSGAAGRDWAGTNDVSSVAARIDGIESMTTGRAADFDGASQFVSQEKSIAAPTTYTAEAWVSTTSTRGGQILGFGHTRAATNNAHDRHVYMTDAGKIIFGVWTDSAQTVASSASYNDGRWHHVVTTLGPKGLQLFVDGVLVGSRTEDTLAGVFDGYWNVGGNSLGGWTSAPTSDFLDGAIDNVALYPTVLTPQSVAAHFAAAPQSTPTNAAPTASFTASGSGLQLTVDGSASSDPDGTVASYAWTFGDGATGTGRTAPHAYSAAGTYTVTLRVVDNDGASSAIASKSVTVTEATTPVPTVIARDDFERSVTTGWGSASVGGAWSSADSRSSVASGTGRLALSPTESRTQTLSGVKATDTDTVMSFSLDQPAGTSAHYVSAIGRSVGSERYTARVVIDPTTARLDLQVTGVTIASVALPSLAFAAGKVVTVRLQVTGTGTTTLRAKAWTGSAEPTSWQVTKTDTKAALQAPGTIGVYFYSGRPNPTTLSLLDFVTTKP